MKIFIDPGHGGNDNGAAYGDRYDYLEEDDHNLAVGIMLQYELMLAGHRVMMSRTSDIDVNLRSRAIMANVWGADVFVSIHADAWHKQTTSGISTHIHPACSPQALRLGECVHASLAERLAERVNRGLKRSDFYVLRKTTMPAILVECEFISNPDSRRFLREPENQQALAQIIRYGISRYASMRGAGL